MAVMVIVLALAVILVTYGLALIVLGWARGE